MGEKQLFLKIKLFVIIINMSKRFFQRLIAVLFIVLILFIDIANVYKEVIIIVFSLALFLSTFNIRRPKRD